MIGYEVLSLATSGDVQTEVLLFREQGAVIDRVEGRTDLAREAVKNRKASGSTQKSGSTELARLLPARQLLFS